MPCHGKDRCVRGSFSAKGKQAIIGTVVDEMKIEGIKNIEVILEGEGQNFTT